MVQPRRQDADAAVRHRKAERLFLLTGLAQGVLWGPWALAAVAWWVVDLGLSPLRLVILGTVLEMAVLLSESPTGAVADVFSRKWSQVISWVIMGVAGFALALSPNLGVLLFWQAIWGFGYTFQSGADLAWVTDEIGREDDRLVMRRAIWRSVGFLVGLAAGVLALVLGVGVMAVMMASGLATLVFGLALAAVMPEHNFRPVENWEQWTIRSGTVAVIDTWRRGLTLIRGSRVLLIIVVVTVLMSMADELVDRLDMLRLIELGAPAVSGAKAAVWFGLGWMLLTVLTLGVMVFVNRRDPEQSNESSARSVVALAGLGGLGIVLMAIGPLAVAFVGWALRDVMREVAQPVIDAWTNRNAETSVRATALSFRSQAMAAGEIGGGLALGGLAEFVSLWVVFGLAGCAYLAAAAMAAPMVDR